MAEAVLLRELSPNMEEGTISTWNVKEGDRVSVGDVLCEVETDKASAELESASAGTLLKIITGEGESAEVGGTIAVIGEEGEDISEFLQESPAAVTSGGAASSDSAVYTSVSGPNGGSRNARGKIKISPLAKKTADNRGIDYSALTGSGPGGRIVRRDIDQAAASGAARTAQAGTVPAGTAGAAVSASAQFGPAEETAIPVTKKRAIIARRLSESKFTAPHFYLKLSIEMDRLIESRKQLNQRLAGKSGGGGQGGPAKVSLNAFLVKFAAAALAKHPRVNASWQEENIIQYPAAHIGLAVAQEDGLITPVVRDCQAKGIVEIDREMKELIDRALTNKLGPEEYSGATFTISNLGSFGIEEFTAIINPPGSAILAVGSVAKQQVVEEDDSVSIKQMMRVTLSCDHRVIDGAAGARFLADLKTMIEDPAAALY